MSCQQIAKFNKKMVIYFKVTKRETIKLYYSIDEFPNEIVLHRGAIENSLHAIFFFSNLLCPKEY